MPISPSEFGALPAPADENAKLIERTAEPIERTAEPIERTAEPIASEAAPAAPEPLAGRPAAAPEPPPAAASNEREAIEARPTSPGWPPLAVHPHSGSAHYRIHYGDYRDDNVVARLDLLIEVEGDRYSLRTDGQAAGLMSWFYRGGIAQHSSGLVAAYGLTPQRYTERRGNRAPREFRIGENDGEVLLPSGTRLPAPAGLQDRLSVLVQLALLRQSWPAAFEPGAVIEIPTLASSRIERARWRVVGSETVQTDAGPVDGLRLSRVADSNDDPQIDVWLALDERVLPLRLRVTEPSGRALDQVMVALRGAAH